MQVTPSYGESLPDGADGSAPPSLGEKQCPPEGAGSGPRSGPLGSNKGLSHPDPAKGCKRWPEHMRLRWDHGDLHGYVRGRCRATNLCPYCAIQSAHENAKMLALDALDGPAPELVAILGTRTATDDPEPFYDGRRLIMRALRRRWPSAEYASQCEFTTGKGKRAGGQRRPHWNLLFKGIPASDVDQVREVVREVWCRHVDAEPEAQYVEELRDAAALMRYVAMHFQKESQAPPRGWKGQRFNCSRGYFYGRTRAEMRRLARAELQRERELWKVAQAAPELDTETVMDIAEGLLWRHHQRTWTLVGTPIEELTPMKLQAGVVRPPDAVPDSRRRGP